MSRQRKIKRSATKSDLIKNQSAAKQQYFAQEAKFRSLLADYQAYRSLLVLLLSREGGELTVNMADYEGLPREGRILFEPHPSDVGGIVVRLIDLVFDDEGEEE